MRWSSAWLPGSSWIWVVVAVLAGAVGAGAALLRLWDRAPTEAELPQLTLLGKPLELDAQAPKRALERVRRHVSGTFSLSVPDGEVQRFSYGDFGVRIDTARLTQLLRDSVDRTSPLSRWRQRHDIPSSAELTLPLPLDLDPERTLGVLLRLKDEFDRPSSAARLDLERRAVVPSSEGLVLDVDASLHAIRSALENGANEAALVFEKLLPERRTEELTNVRFDHVLASFDTPYDPSLASAARTFNLRLSASKLDGTVLLPGEVFDFNQVVGPRDEANGYKVAPVIARGELVDGIGGGTCQISGTLHGAAFFAGLEIVERYPHTRPSSYIKLGLDATVVYPTINYRFRNPYDFPVVLHQTVKDGKVVAEILGPETGLTTTLIRRILSASPYEQIERPDPRLPKGKRVLSQRGVPGFSVQMHRIRREGPHAIRETWRTQYPPTTQIVLEGTGEAESTKSRADDSHPEYTADELLILTMSRNPSERSPSTSERREAGKYGNPGWAREAGMPVFERN